jgi:hypothetical protein
MKLTNLISYLKYVKDGCKTHNDKLFNVVKKTVSKSCGLKEKSQMN